MLRSARNCPCSPMRNSTSSGLVEMTGYRVGEQNVVGTRLPILDHVEFAVADYSRLATPAWVDILVERLKDAAEARVRARIAGERVRIARPGGSADHAAGEPLREDPDPDREEEHPAHPHLPGRRRASRRGHFQTRQGQAAASRGRGFRGGGRMSIVPLERVTFAGLSSEKDRLLDDLHARGCLELIPLGSDAKDPAGGGPSSQAREALKFLLACPQRRRQVRDDARFDAESVERQALELQKSIQALESERDCSSPAHCGRQAVGRFPLPVPAGDGRAAAVVLCRPAQGHAQGRGDRAGLGSRPARSPLLLRGRPGEDRAAVHARAARPPRGPLARGTRAASGRGGTGHRGRPGGAGASDAMVPPVRARPGPAGGCRRPCRRGAADVRPGSAVRAAGLGAAGARSRSWQNTRHETDSSSKAGLRLPTNARRR